MNKRENLHEKRKGNKESIHETEKPLREEKIVKCLEEETSW
jgi:hypothetical protein